VPTNVSSAMVNYGYLVADWNESRLNLRVERYVIQRSHT
jgi:hypothetical protein